MSTTQAMRFLKQKKIPFETREYDFKVKGAEYAAEVLAWPVEAMVKTLVVALADSSNVLCLMPAHLELSLKKLAREAKVKNAAMASNAEAEKLTGYLVGGISPFGTKKRLKVWMHESILELDKMGINCGRRGLICFLEPKAALDALGGVSADISM